MKKDKILFVDDNITRLKTIEELLCDTYCVNLAVSCNMAVRLIQNDYVPNLILVDADMHVDDGFLTFCEIQKIELLSHVPLIIITQDTDTEAKISSLRIGVADFIMKPIKIDVLKALIDALIQDGKEKCKIAQVEVYRDFTMLDDEKIEKIKHVLSPTEMQIARLIVVGFSNKEIADKTGYSYGYVKKVTSNIYNKLGVNKRGEIRSFFL